MYIPAGSTDQTVYFVIQDSTGARKTGVVYTDLTGRYVRTRGTVQALALSALGSVNASHTDGGFIELDSTNAKGVYRLDLPDACFATGARLCEVNLQGADLFIAAIEIELLLPSDVANAIVTSGATVSYNSPVASDDELTLYVGDDYVGTRTLTLTITGVSGFDLDGTDGTFRLLRRSKWEQSDTTADVEIAASFSQTGSTVTATIEIAADDVAALATNPPKDPRNYRYQVVAETTSGGGTVHQTLVDGWCSVVKTIEAAA